MQTASFIGFIRTLFYIMIAYYILKFLARLFLPLLVKKMVDKAGANFQQHAQQPRNTSWNRTKSGEEIFYNPTDSKNPKETKKVGDYVDYEEID